MSDHSCEQARELMAGAWMDGVASTELQLHLDNCVECAAEMASLGGMWEKLGDLPVAEPGASMRIRWEEEMLSLPRRARKSFWPAQPTWQMAIAGLCLAIGLGAGAFVERGRGERDEVARLREEVASTREMVALSMLQQQSAAERLRGVDYSAQMPSMEPQVVAALIQAVNRDPNVNVRLASIDALGKVANDTRVRASMQQALRDQDSPMVQAALIDYLLDARDRNSLGAMRELVSRPGVNPTVRERASYAVQQLAH